MKILVAGVGAIGSNLAKNLVADLKGEHEITILDKDAVEERNVTAGTQFYSPDQIGITKVEALQLNLYRWYEREVTFIHGDVKDINLVEYELIIDCLDNHDARKFLQDGWIGTLAHGGELLHIGFSDKFTFAIEWAENYQVPTDITSGFDICEMNGAAAFVAHVGALGALVAEKWINEEEKIEIVGGKFYASRL